MHGRIWAAVCGALIGLVLAAPASAQFSPGARTLGEPYLFLQHIGNGGYDAQHYDITIDYDPIAHSMVSSTDLTARATQGLSEFSLDFVSYYTVSSVKVNGVDATWTRDDDAPPTSRSSSSRRPRASPTAPRSTSWSPTAGRRRTSSTPTTRSRALCARRRPRAPSR